MNRYLKMVIIRGFQGILISMAISYTIFMFSSLGEGSSSIASSEIVFQYTLAVIVGFWMAASSVIYEVDELSVLGQTIIHALVISPFIPFAFIVGWAPPSVIGGILYVLIFILVFILIWQSFKIYYAKQAKELNEKLNRRNQ